MLLLRKTKKSMKEMQKVSLAKNDEARYRVVRVVFRSELVGRPSCPCAENRGRGVGTLVESVVSGKVVLAFRVGDEQRREGNAPMSHYD
jgi:hypothetical protein